MGGTRRSRGYASRGRLPSPPLWPARLPSGWATLTPWATRPAISTNSSRAVLKRTGFTGTIESSLPARLGRPLDSRLADLGRLLWFDTLAPARRQQLRAAVMRRRTASATRQSIAIGIQNNNVVGPHRAGPRNQRRTPTVVNTAFYPEAHVERPLLGAFGRSVRQLAGLPSSRCPKARRDFPPAIRSSPTCSSRRRTSRRPNWSKSPASPARAGTIGPASTRSTTAWAARARRRTPAAFATSRSARRCSRG